MADIRKIKIDTFVQVITKGKPNRRAKVVGKTEKRVYLNIMEKGRYIRDEKGRPVRFMKHPKNIRFYTR